MLFDFSNKKREFIELQFKTLFFAQRDRVVESIKLVEGVEETHALYGVYDLLVKIKAMSSDKLKEIIKLKIRQMAGVTSSLTLMIVEDR